MYVPNPLGRCPLILRRHDITNYKNGELLIDYEEYDIYYINYETGEKISITRDIYNKILETKAENTKIVVSDEDVEVLDRNVNTFYYMIKNRETITEE